VPLQLFAFAHLNLAFSSIEEEQRPIVIERCYWPLLRLAKRFNLPLGIEASGYTLECIAELDPSCLAELRRLVTEGLCEFIGSGYAQVIGPLLPAEANVANLRCGSEVYERLLGFRPRLALVNEQAYASGLVPLYLESGYDAVVMEWNNPARSHPDWNPEWRYYPQRACGPTGETIPVIWNESVAFQKFQRYAHGDIELPEFLAYVRGHAAQDDRALPVYGNDVELFDFRPRRLMTEAPLHVDGEWKRINDLFAALVAEAGMRFVKPSEVLDMMPHANAGHELHLESAAHPVPVKKQEKYNILRWAVTGRDDVSINTRCWRLYEALRNDARASEDDWRELCYLWSSDFRTHITDRRWKGYQERLGRRVPDQSTVVEPDPRAPNAAGSSGSARVVEDGHRLVISADGVEVTLNRRRGLAIESLRFPDVAPQALCGTVPHGTFDHIRFSPDWYTGNLVFEAPAQHKVTDLEPAVDVTWADDGAGGAIVRGVVPTALGPVKKELVIGGERGGVELSFDVDWPTKSVGSLRLGFVTLLPGAFDAATLFYRTHNGGRDAETFPLADKVVEHGAPVSALVSASHALGVTDGVLEIGDRDKAVTIEVEKATSALVGMISHHPLGRQVFCQSMFSAEEIDDTRRLDSSQTQRALVARMRISARRLSCVAHAPLVSSQSTA
jgi:hypothetical protein